MGKKKLSRKNKLKLPRRKLTPHFKIKKPLKKKASSYKKNNVTKNTPNVSINKMYNKKPKLTKKKVSKNKMKKSSKKKLSTISKKKNIQRGGLPQPPVEAAQPPVAAAQPQAQPPAQAQAQNIKPPKSTSISRKAIRQGTYQTVAPEEPLYQEKPLYDGKVQYFNKSENPDFHHKVTDVYDRIPDETYNNNNTGEGIDFSDPVIVYAINEALITKIKTLEDKKNALEDHIEEKQKQINEQIYKQINEDKKTQLKEELKILQEQQNNVNTKINKANAKLEKAQAKLEKAQAKAQAAADAKAKKAKKAQEKKDAKAKAKAKKAKAKADPLGYTDIAPDEPELAVETLRKPKVETLRKELAVETLTEPKVYKAEKKMEYKTKQILFHFNIFKHMVIQKDLALYNLENVNMNGDLSTLDAFYFYNKNKIENVIIDKDKTQHNYFFYLNHNDLFKDNPLINLILFVSSGGKLLEKFVYGIEIQKESSPRDDISIGTLTIDKSDCFYYILNTKEFPTFILNSNNDEFKKITSVFDNNNSWKDYTKYNYIKVLQHMSKENKIEDTSDENYNLLMSDDDDNKYSEKCENPIENFEKYRILNLSKKEKIKDCIKKYDDTQIIKMLIETYKYYDLNITSTDIEDELIKLLNEINQKELFELFFDKLLDS